MKRISYIVAGMVSMGTAVASPWPVGIADEATAISRQPTKISVIDNDIGDNLYISSVNAWSRNAGRIVINDDKKSVTYTSGDATSDEFWYVLKDDQGRSNAAKVTVSISTGDSPVGGWPSASGDTAEATYGEAITIPVLDNDSGTDLKLVSVNEWSTNKGKISISSDNEVTYRQYGDPRGDQIDTFWYVFEDKWGRKNAAKVTVSIKEVQTGAWPTATADIVEAKNGVNIMIPVLDNDEGSGLVLTASNEWTQKGGKTQIVDGLIRYTPPSNFTGNDYFWYDFEDKFGRTNSAKVTVDVAPNAELSVVEFCENTYESDGTPENTVLTNLSPSASSEPYQILDDDEVSGENGAEIADRRYYIEGQEETGLSVWMDIGGTKSKVVEAAAGEPVYLVGAYNQHIYFAKGFNLFAHNGEKLTDFGYLFDGIFDQSNDNARYSILSYNSGGALTFRAVNIDAVAFVSKSRRWRVSDGLDLHMVQVHDVETNTENDPWTSGVFVTKVYDSKYFNGLDYRFQYRYDWGVDRINEYSFSIYDRNEAVHKVIGSSDGAMVENNNRLFVTIKNREATGSTLYIVDNYKNTLVELLSCD